MSDSRLQAARALHAESAGLLVSDDPADWTYARLAREIGCSPELIAYIITGRNQNG